MKGAGHGRAPVKAGGRAAVVKLLGAVAGLALLPACWHMMEVPLALYELRHPPPICGPVPNDGRAYDCESADGGHATGPGHWVCQEAAPFGLQCDGGLRPVQEESE